MNSESKDNWWHLLLIGLITFSVFLGVGRFVWVHGTTGQLPVDAIDESSRMINAIFGAVLTAMAIIVSLASNLYTPTLVRIFVSHPSVYLGLGGLLGINLVVILCNLISPDHHWYPLCIELLFILSCAALAGVLPFLYYVCQFLRPAYFLSLLKESAIKGLAKLRAAAYTYRNYQKVFGNLDVLSNVALTAASRDDRQTMKMVMGVFDDLLKEMMTAQNPSEDQWREHDSRFVPGTSTEGRLFLLEQKTWPEAYLLARQIHVLKGLSFKHNEVVSDSCEKLLETCALAVSTERLHVAQMHLMVFNSLFGVAIADKDFERFETISYYYRHVLERVMKDHDLSESAFESWLHYGKEGHDAGIDFAWQTVLYDCGLLLLDVALRNEKQAIEWFETHIKPAWMSAFDVDEKLAKASHRSAVRAYWEAIARGYHELGRKIESVFLKNEAVHRDVLKAVLEFNSPMNWEFNDRFMRLTYLTPPAENLARVFLNPEAEGKEI